MDNESNVEHIVRSLSFGVEAVPQDNIVHVTTASKSATLNVKIKVRKKDVAGFQHGVLSLSKPNQSKGKPQRIRLVSSDQTIMSFNVVMETDLDKPINKPRKKIMGIFKPTICLGSQPDEDDYAYLPSSSYKSDANEEIKSEGALSKYGLLKSDVKVETSPKLPKRNKVFFGKCKPGGCLDPPFGEEKYPYTATDTETSSTKKSTKTKTSSVFSNKLFTWKRKSHDDQSIDIKEIKNEIKTESDLGLYQAGSLQTSEIYSNSIITYPPKLNSSELRVQEARQRGSKTFSNMSKNSFNVASGSYFILPKKTIDIHENGSTLKPIDIGNNISKVDMGMSIQKEGKRPLTKDSVTEIQLPKDVKSKYFNAEFVEDMNKKENQVLLNQKPVGNLDKTSLLTERTELKYIPKPATENYSRSKNIAAGMLAAGATAAVAGIVINTESVNKMEEKASLKNNIYMLDTVQNKNKDLFENVRPPHKTDHFSNKLGSQKSTGAVELKSYTYDDDLKKDPVSYTEIRKQLPGYQIKTTEIESTKPIEKADPSVLKYISKPATIENDTSKSHNFVKAVSTTDASAAYAGFTPQNSGNNEEIEKDKIVYEDSHDIKTMPNKSEFIDTIKRSHKIEDIRPAYKTDYSSNALGNTETVVLNNDHALISDQLFNTETESSVDQHITHKNGKTVTVGSNGAFADIVNKTGGIQEIVKGQLLEPSRSDNIDTKSLNINKMQETELNTNQVQLDKMNDFGIYDYVIYDDIDDLSISNVKPQNKTNSNVIQQNNDKIETNNIIDKVIYGQKTEDKSNIELNYEVETILPDQNIEKNKGDKSLMTLASARREMSNYDLIKTNDEKTKTIEDFEHNGSMRNIPTPIERDSHLERFGTVERDDLQQIWKNKAQPPYSEIQVGVHSDKILNKHIDPYQKNVDTLNENFYQASLGDVSQIKPELTDVKEIDDQEYFEKDNEIKLAFKFLDVEEDSGSRNFKTRDIFSNNVVSKTNELIKTLDESVKIETPQLEQHEPFKEQNEWMKTYSQNVFEEPQMKLNYNPDQIQAFQDSTMFRDVSNGNDNKIHEFDIKDIKITQENELLKKKIDNLGNNTVPINTDLQNSLKSQLYDSRDEQKQQQDIDDKTSRSQRFTKHAYQQKHVAKQFKFGSNEFVRNRSENRLISPISRDHIKISKLTPLDSGLALRSGPEGIVSSHVGYRSDRSLLEENDLGANQQVYTNKSVPENISKNAAFLKINLGLQSYIDDKNEMILKTFDLDKVPVRYPNDNIKVTTRHIKIGDELKIPIDPDNDLYIKIKRNNRKDLSGVEGRMIIKENLDSSNSGKIDDAYKNESDQIQRKVIIADDIRRTLVVVYEEELLPLRNTIAELEHNLEMLTSQQMVLRGHMFVKKPRPSRIAPLYKKCGCMRK